MKVYVMSGPSGSGKSTKAKELAKQYATSVICSADDFFMKNGRYEFDVRLLKKAHEACKNKFTEALKSKIECVIVDNTNTERWEYQPYLNLAKQYDYESEFVRLGSLDDKSLKEYANRNKHSVPLDIIRKQAARIAKDNRR